MKHVHGYGDYLHQAKATALKTGSYYLQDLLISALRLSYSYLFAPLGTWQISTSKSTNYIALFLFIT